MNAVPVTEELDKVTASRRDCFQGILFVTL